MHNLDALTKAAAAASVALILALQWAIHPDITTLLRVLAAAAFVAGWAWGRSERAHAIWVLAVVLAPAPLRLLTGREGPVLDLVWAAGLGAALLRSMTWSQWSFPAAWRVLLGGYALTLALAWPVLVAREAGFAIEGLSDTGAITSWAGLSATQTIAWILAVVLTQLLALLWFDRVYARVASSEGAMPEAVHAFWVAVTIASVAALCQGMVDLQFLSTEFWAARYRATGTMLDANAYGVAAALAGPIAFTAVRASRAARALPVGVALLAINWTGMWLSGSRTALLVAIAGAIGLAADLWRTRDVSRGAVAAVATAAAAVLVVALAAGAAGPLQRLGEMPGGRSIADMPDRWAAAAELWQRGGYGVVAGEMVREFPIGGVGVGSYPVMAPDYWRMLADDQLPFDNAQNWWRHVLAELGWVGALPVLIWSLLVAWHVIAPRFHTRNRNVYSGATVRALLIGIGLCSLVGVPTQNAVVLLAFFAIAAWALRPAASVENPPHVLLRTGWIIVTAAALAYAGTHLVLASGRLAAAERAKQSGREYVAGAFASEVANGVTYRWTDDDSRFIWPASDRWLVMSMWAYHPDITEQPVRVALSTVCDGPFFEEALLSREPVSVGMRLPEGLNSVDVRVQVSRTWRPADVGAGDRRTLGVAVAADFTGSDVGMAQMRLADFPVCPAS